MQRLEKSLFYIALAFIVYMPLHVLIVQWFSLATGGIEIWKAAKDIVTVVLVPLLLFISYQKGLFSNKTFRWLAILASAYAVLHLLFVVFDSNDDTYSAIVGSVYNIRLVGYLLFGLVLGSFKNGDKYLRHMLTATVLVATAVAAFGVAQYFLPPDLLTHVGYSLERGVKPLFLIDDRPELPRVMSTLKDPNSLGAYLIIPILLTGWSLMSAKVQDSLFVRRFRKEVLVVMLMLQLVALVLTFSRGALLGIIISIAVLLCIVYCRRSLALAKKYWYVPLTVFILLPLVFYLGRNTAIVQDYVFHAAVSTTEEDPNQKRITLQQEAVDDILGEPQGYGPGSAGLVSISNPQGGLLTENYYLQIAYEIGWLGLTIFLGILGILIYKLQETCKLRSQKSPIAAVMLASLAGYLFYSLLIHLWSNEALALQWWLLCGAIVGMQIFKYDKHNDTNT
jgi:hypothetical protein